MGLAARSSADQLVAEVKALRDLGVHHVILETRMRDLADMIATYERFTAEVIARL
jgi:ketopantoate hydroxymethyltransferase